MVITFEINSLFEKGRPRENQIALLRAMNVGGHEIFIQGDEINKAYDLTRENELGHIKVAKKGVLFPDISFYFDEKDNKLGKYNLKI